MHSTSGTRTRSAFWAAMNPIRMRSSVRDGDGARGLHHLGEAAVTARIANTTGCTLAQQFDTNAVFAKYVFAS